MNDGKTKVSMNSHSMGNVLQGEVTHSRISVGSSGSERDGRVYTQFVHPVGGSRVRWAPGREALHTAGRKSRSC